MQSKLTVTQCESRSTNSPKPKSSLYFVRVWYLIILHPLANTSFKIHIQKVRFCSISICILYSHKGILLVRYLYINILITLTLNIIHVMQTCIRILSNFQIKLNVGIKLTTSRMTENDRNLRFTNGTLYIIFFWNLAIL